MLKRINENGVTFTTVIRFTCFYFRFILNLCLVKNDTSEMQPYILSRAIIIQIRHMARSWVKLGCN